MNKPTSHPSSNHDLPTIGIRCVGVAVALAFAMGSLGFWLYDRENEIHAAPLSPFYHALQLFVLHSPYLGGKMNGFLEVARWLAPLSLGWFAVTGVMALFIKDLRLFLLPAALWAHGDLRAGTARAGTRRMLWLLSPGAAQPILLPTPWAGASPLLPPPFLLQRRSHRTPEPERGDHRGGGTRGGRGGR